MPDKIEKRHAQHALHQDYIVAVLNIHFAESNRRPTKQIRINGGVGFLPFVTRLDRIIDRLEALEAYPTIKIPPYNELSPPLH